MSGTITPPAELASIPMPEWATEATDWEWVPVDDVWERFYSRPFTYCVLEAHFRWSPMGLERGEVRVDIAGKAGELFNDESATVAQETRAMADELLMVAGLLDGI